MSPDPGSAELANPRTSITRESPVKGFRRGTHRQRSPERTLELARSLAPQAGITRVANVTGLDSIGLPVVAVYRPNARSLAVSQGKGLDLTAAMTSGLMEAIESHHAEHMENPLRLATYSELSSRARVVDVERLPRLATSQLSCERSTLWVTGTDLMSGGDIFVPYEMVHTNYTLPLPTGSGLFVMSSNGLASGNHLQEATSHAICEVIERDALALWSLRGGPALEACRIDPESIDDPDCRAVLSQFAAADVAYGIWDATSDIGLATFVCVIVDRHTNVFRRLYFATGSGCHPTREIALLRALTEAAQCRLTYICGARDDADREFFRHARDEQRLHSMRVCIERPLTGAARFSNVPSYYSERFDDDVEWELKRLAAVGIRELALVDLTLPQFQLPVVRVVIPGLESLHDVPGYVPGARARALAGAGAA